MALLISMSHRTVCDPCEPSLLPKTAYFHHKTCAMSCNPIGAPLVPARVDGAPSAVLRAYQSLMPIRSTNDHYVTFTLQSRTWKESTKITISKMKSFSGMADANDTDLGVRSIMNIKHIQAEYKHAWIYAVLKFSGPLTRVR